MKTTFGGAGEESPEQPAVSATRTTAREKATRLIDRRYYAPSSPLTTR
jgi:hypothetical protein